MFPNWPNFDQIGAQKTSHGSNFHQMGKIRPILVAGIELRAFDRF
jgi:hypothetical protein